MKKNLMSTAALALALGFAGPAAAQSAKFAAVYDADQVDVSAIVQDVANGSDPANGDPRMISESDMATIHVPSQKELLINVSSVVNIVTVTKAKGRNGAGESTSVADGGVGLSVAVVPEGTQGACDLAADSPNWAIPGNITLSSRVQTLSVDVDLDVVDDLTQCGGTDQPACIANTLNIDGSVSVALGLDTTAAHSFQFLALDLSAGDYDVVACYDLSAFAEIINGYDTSADGADSDGNLASTFVAIGKRVVTVQEVRAVKDSIKADID